MTEAPPATATTDRGTTVAAVESLVDGDPHPPVRHVLALAVICLGFDILSGGNS